MVLNHGANDFTGGAKITSGTLDFTNGALGSTASLVKSGSGWLTLSAASTYSGGSTATAGILNFATGGLGGTGTIGGSVTVEAAGNLAPGVLAGTLSIGGGLDVAAMAGGAGTLKFELGTDTASSDQIAVTGTLTLGVGALGFGDFEFTDPGGLQPGTYTLATSGGINLQRKMICRERTQGTQR